ncbi:MAG: ATP-binding cassette domain-containing protein [Chitinispirillaceae bacterium]
MISVENLQFTYRGAKEETLHKLRFSISKGEIFGFLGPSGSGKSTTQKILTGLLKEYSGKVEVGGREIRKISPDYYEKVGVVFKFPNLFTKFTALENLAYFRRSLLRENRRSPEASRYGGT